MKKFFLFIVVLIFVIFSWIGGKYNSMVSLDENVKEKRSQVENVYQRRADLIPNLVNTVKGYASHEESVFVSVTEARSKSTQTNIDINDANSFAQFQKSQGELSSALSRLMAISENYPDLKANQNFLELQTQLEGTENRISVERMRYNEIVKQYNIFVRSFPNKLLASIFGFELAQLFESQEGANIVPEVNF